MNRIWSHHFGHGIVATLDNFGKMGDLPTNPDLLDWLTVEFMERGWSMKQMHRLLMTSEAYRMSSQFTMKVICSATRKTNFNGDFARGDSKPRSCAMQSSAVSGSLNREIGGPPFFQRSRTKYWRR